MNAAFTTAQTQTTPKRFPRLTFNDAPMFDRVMRDEDVCKGMVEAILGAQVDHVDIHETEYAIEPHIGSRGVRLDAYVKAGNAVYDIEMQNYAKGS